MIKWFFEMVKYSRIAFFNANALIKVRLATSQCHVRALALENSNSTLFYHSKKSLYHYTIPFYNTSSIPNFYFSILLIKIIYLHNKIIYPKITSSLPSLFSLSNFQLSSICNFRRSLYFWRGSRKRPLNRFKKPRNRSKKI